MSEEKKYIMSIQFRFTEREYAIYKDMKNIIAKSADEMFICIMEKEYTNLRSEQSKEKVLIEEKIKVAEKMLLLRYSIDNIIEVTELSTDIVGGICKKPSIPYLEEQKDEVLKKAEFLSNVMKLALQ